MFSTDSLVNVRTKVVINAPGPFTDSITQMDNVKMKMIVQPSAGIHIMMPGYYSPKSMGLLHPATSNGQVTFFLLWQGERWVVKEKGMNRKVRVEDIRRD